MKILIARIGTLIFIILSFVLIFYSDSDKEFYKTLLGLIVSIIGFIFTFSEVAKQAESGNKARKAQKEKYFDEQKAEEFYEESRKKCSETSSNDDYHNESNRYQTNNNISLKLQEAYDTLGVKNAADKDTVTKAYHLLCKDFHPDAYQSVNIGENAKKLLEAQFLKIKDAYELILENL